MRGFIFLLSLGALPGAFLGIAFGSPDLHWLFRALAGGIVGLVVVDPVLLQWFDNEARRRREQDTVGS